MGDSEYPGTADERLETCKNRAKSLTSNELSQDWEAIVRPKLLWAAGLRDLTNVAPGKGNTGHCFNDFNHVDATTMLMQTADNEHDGSVRGIAVGNQLGEGIRAASLPDAGPGGDVVHVFARRQSRTSARRRARAPSLKSRETRLGSRGTGGLFEVCFSRRRGHFFNHRRPNRERPQYHGARTQFSNVERRQIRRVRERLRE